MFKAKWLILPNEEQTPFEKKKRDHMAKQGTMRECITDALHKSEGGNCSRSYASLVELMHHRNVINSLSLLQLSH
jgi:hypothetical protein